MSTKNLTEYDRIHTVVEYEKITVSILTDVQGFPFVPNTFEKIIENDWDVI